MKKTAVVNLQSQYYEDFLDEAYDTLITYSRYPGANVVLQSHVPSETGMQVCIDAAGDTLTIDTCLLGDFNGENIAAAVAVLRSLSLSPKQIVQGIQATTTIP